MAAGDFSMLVADVDVVLAESWDLRPKMQWCRHGNTINHLRGRIKSKAWTGKAYNWKMFVGGVHGARINTFANVRAAAYEVPPAMKPSYQELQYNYDDLRVIEHSVDLNEWAEEITENRTFSVWQVAKRMMMEAELDFGDRVNKGFHQDSTATMAKVAATYDLDGTSYTGAATIVYVKVDEGAIAMFSKNQVIQFRAASAPGTVRVCGNVAAVISDAKGPMVAGTYPGTANGPGIVVNYDAAATTRQSGADTAFDNVADGDEIVLEGEGDSNFWGLPSLADPTVNMWLDGSHSAINRDDGEHDYLLPYTVDTGSVASPTTLDLDVQLREIGVWLPNVVKTAALMRKMHESGGTDPTKGVFWKEYLYCIAQPDLIDEATQDVVDTVRFTAAMASSLSEAQKKYLVGQLGFDDIVWKSPSLGHVAFLPDPVCREYWMYITDPNAWFGLTLSGGPNDVEWIKDQKGNRFFQQRGTNGRLTYSKDASCHAAFLFSNDQPKTTVPVRYVKSSLR